MQKETKSKQLTNLKYKLKNILSIITNNNIEIQESNEAKYENNILFLPKEINIFSTTKINFYIYLYISLICIESEKKKIFIPQYIKNNIQINIIKLIIINSLHKKIIKKFPGMIKIIKIIYQQTIKKKLNIKLFKEYNFFSELISRKIINNNFFFKEKIKKKELQLIQEVINKKTNSQHELENNLNYILIKITKKYPNIDKTKLIEYFLWEKINLKETNNNYLKKIKTIQKIKNKEIKTEIKNSQNNINTKNIKLKKKKKENSIQNIFDYTKTIESYKSGKKEINNKDELKNHLDALNEIDINETFLTNEISKSIFSKELTQKNFFNIKDIIRKEKYKKFIYDEWDAKNKQYKKNWCTVYEKTVNNNNKKEENFKKIIQKNNNLINNIKLNIKKILKIITWKDKQLDGGEIDIESAINMFSSIKAGYSTNEKLYIKKTNSNKKLSILILLDSSLSTDSLIKKTKIIDFIKEITIIISESIKEIAKYLLISTFNSNTRQECNYFIIKNKNETWDKSKYKILNIKPNGYTRIGAALRHSIKKIKNFKTKKKLIILISDNKPTDFDKYEGIYGIEDINRVIKESKKLKIILKSITIKSNQNTYFSKMLGKKNFFEIEKKNQIKEIIINILQSSIKKNKYK